MRAEVFKLTHDEWHPSYTLNNWYDGNAPGTTKLVQVSLLPLSNRMWRVCVWGGDDCGYEQDFVLEAEAWNVFLQVIGWQFVNIQPLKDIGFIHA